MQGGTALNNYPRLFQPGRIAVLYFTTPDCVTCKAFQRPQLRKLESMLGDQVQVVEVDLLVLELLEEEL